MRVKIDYELAQALNILAAAGIRMPSALLGDLLEEELGTHESAGELAAVTADLYRKWKAAPEGVLRSTDGRALEIFPETWTFLFRATRDAFAEMEAETRAGWDREMKRRAKVTTLRIAAEQAGSR